MPFFDAHGLAIRGAVHDRVVAVELDDLAAIVTAIGVATDAGKVSGVLGAIRGVSSTG